MQVPYIFTSPRVFVKEAVDFDNERGVVYREVGGEHSIWAARVPFLPAMLSDDFRPFGKERIRLIQQRQFRFIYDLARARENRATFELRFISTPNPVPGQPNLIDIVFLGKVFSIRQRAGQAFAERLWDKFASNFPLEDPFNYPLEPVTEEARFWEYYEPIPFAEIERSRVLEIRKYEDMPIRNVGTFGRVERVGDYIAHPFVPNVDFSPMGRFFAALAAQPQKCYVGVSIRPTRMFDQEIHNVSFAIGQFKQTIAEENDVTDEYIRTRSAIGAYVYQGLMAEREQLVTVRVHLVGEYHAPYGLAEALGSEMMGNVNNKYPTQWVSAQPADRPGEGTEMEAALNNLRYLEQEMWGDTIAAPPLQRLRYLATAQEAYGAFRLPVPPESGYMAGVLVKSEPFVAPADELELRRQAQANLNDAQEQSDAQAREKKIEIGVVYHRGNPTLQRFSVNVRNLTRHVLVAGATGSGKSTTIKHLLTQLWSKHGIPFLVLYPVDKPDYRELRRHSALAQSLLIFTLGDESTSPFRFNPFEVPEGLLLKTHLSRLMRVFSAAFTLHEPLPMIYREALRQVYREKGWNTILERGEAGREYPIMSEFYGAIRQITDSLDYGREAKDTVRQASVIRIADLLENAGYCINVRRSMDFSRVLSQPAVMEIGRVGSLQDTALLMGFLLMRLAEEIERHPRPADSPHITVVEEAHRLMAESSPALGLTGDTRSAASEDFSNILAEVRGFGEGIIIAEQIPTLLVKGAIANTNLKIMHWLEDIPSFELFSSVMNLDPQQREYARTLGPGYAIVRNPYGRPVHIKVPQFDDQLGDDRTTQIDISDDGTRVYMNEQRQRIGLEDVPLVEWDVSLAVIMPKANTGNKPASVQREKIISDTSINVTTPQTPWRAPIATLGWLMAAPMHTCLFCRPMHETGECKHRRLVRNHLLNDADFRQQRRVELEAAITADDPTQCWQTAQIPLKAIQSCFPDKDKAIRWEIAYCYFAHEIEEFLQETRGPAGQSSVFRKNARSLLQRFAVRQG